jgi:hypothetical protein
MHGRSLPPLGSPDRPLVFVHVPKSAGTAFYVYLRQHFSPDQIAPPIWSDREQVERQRGYALFGQGHIPFRFVEHIHPANHMTFLRDPVKRAISQYRSWHNPKNFSDAWRSRLPPDGVAAIEFAQEATLDDFLLSENPHIVGNISNVHVQLLASVPPRHPSALESALENLERKFVFVGVTDRFQDSIAVLRATFDARHYEVREAHENRSAGEGALLYQRARERVIELNRLDYSLYQAGLALLSARLSEAVPERSTTAS